MAGGAVAAIEPPLVSFGIAGDRAGGRLKRLHVEIDTFRHGRFVGRAE